MSISEYRNRATLTDRMVTAGLVSLFGLIIFGPFLALAASYLIGD